MSITLSIDGCPVTVEKGTTILQAARQINLYIPTLCDYPGLPPSGSCRMCIVEIQGRPNNMPTACTTPAENGMEVNTNSPKVQALRGELLQLLLAEHPSGCMVCPENKTCNECMVTVRKLSSTTGCRTCPKDKDCGLQEMVQKLGVTQIDYPMRYRLLKVKKNDPFFDRDYNLCILCGRCVRVCEKLHFNSSLAFIKRGSEMIVGTSYDRTHLDSDCNFCGACLEVCPTGSLTEKTRKWDGLPEAETRSTCPLCSMGCQLRLLNKNEHVIGALPAAQTLEDPLCVKGRFGITELVNHPTRLQRPQKAAGGHLMHIPWAEAVHLAAEKLAACPPGQFEMRISASCSTEDLYVAQKFTRKVMHSQRFVVPALERYGDGLAALAALLARAQSPALLAQADAVLCLGFDGRYAQSVVDMKIHHARTLGKGRLVTLHAQEHSLGQHADVWLRPQPGDEASFMETLSAALQNPSADLPDSFVRAATLLQNSGVRVVVVGAQFQTHPNNRHLLQAALVMADLLQAALVVAPDEGNLAGALLLGAAASAPTVDVAVQYLVGENFSTAPAGAQPWRIYQNLYPPAAPEQVDLMLPAAAFSESDGSLVAAGGEVLPLRAAVAPPGEAMPAWQTLCKIAQNMGAPGFDFANAAEIRAELDQAAIIPGYALEKQLLPAVFSAALQAGELPAQAQVEVGTAEAHQHSAHTYLGFPLTQWVEGLGMLIPGKEGSRG